MTDKRFPETTISLHEGRTEATIQLGTEAVVVDAASLQNFIGHLGQLREAMLPEVSRSAPEDRQFLQVDGPVLEVVSSTDGAVVQIAMRTPTYGWIGFQFQPWQAAELGRHLVDKYGGRAAPDAPAGPAP